VEATIGRFSREMQFLPLRHVNLMLALLAPLKVGILSHDFEGILIYDSSAARAYINVFPDPLDRFDFVAILIAREEAVRFRPIAAQTNPRFVIPGLMCNMLHSSSSPK
jgi:hypothetical protein